jgi:hypothetical protein
MKRREAKSPANAGQIALPFDRSPNPKVRIEL